MKNNLIQITIRLILLIQIIIKVILLRYNFQIKVQIKLIQNFKKMIIIILIKKI